MEKLRRFSLLVDLDGVLADFDRGFMEMCGSTMPFSQTDEDAAWEAVKRAPHFWLRLAPMPGAIAFWEWLRQFSPAILTSPGSHDTDRAVAEKRQWVDKWLGHSVPVFFRRSTLKHTMASPDSILIDDWKPNIDAWRKAGGHAVHHQGIVRTKMELEQIAEIPDIHAHIRRTA